MEIINKTLQMESVWQIVWAKLTAEVCSGGGKVCKKKKSQEYTDAPCIHCIKKHPSSSKSAVKSVVLLQSEACSAPIEKPMLKHGS